MSSFPSRFSVRAWALVIALLCTSFAALAAQDRPREQASSELRQRLQVLRTAVDAFRETNRAEALERVERAMHALELTAADRRDEEALRIRQSAPKPEELAELLRLASRLHAGWNHPDRADALARMAEALTQDGARANPAESREGRVWRERLENHIGIVERARALYDRAGWETNAGKLAHALEVARAALRLGPEEGERLLRESDLDRGALAEILSRAARLAGEQGAEQDAAAFREIAEHLRSSLTRPPSSSAEPDEREGRLRRLAVLRHARAAWAEADQKEQARLLERFIHGGELQLEGAAPEISAKAFEGLTMGLVIELLRGAADLYEQRFSHADRARQCRELATFYAQREKASSEPQGSQREKAERLQALAKQVEELRAALERVQRELRELGGR